MLTIISLLAFGLSFTVIYALFKWAYANFFAVQKRLDKVIDSNSPVQEEKTFFQAYLARKAEKEKQKGQQKKKKHSISKLQKQLEESGLIRKYSVLQWSLMKNMMSVVLGGAVFFVGIIIKRGLPLAGFLAFVVIMAVQLLFHYMIVASVNKRKHDILKSLPYTLDLVTVSVEAGLSFDGAIAKVMDTTDNALTFEFSRALKEMRMGIERRKALRALSDRCNVKELTTVVNALIQADDLGVSLGKVLRIQAEQVREFRKQVAREKSMKAPVKMLFPLIFFIFPTVFVIILGPAVIRIVDFFK